MLLWFILLGPVLLVTITVHELGHALAARSVGGSASSILLWPLGGLAFISHQSGPKADIWVAIAGPLTHVPMILIWICLLASASYAYTGSSSLSLLPMPYPSTPSVFFVALSQSALFMNICLILFNLFVPAYPLDGGRILVDLLILKGFSPGTTSKIVISVAVPLALAIAAVGCYYLQFVTVLIAIFILFSCYQLFDSMRQGQLDHHPLFFTPPPIGSISSTSVLGIPSQQGVARGRVTPPAASYYNLSGGPEGGNKV